MARLRTAPVAQNAAPTKSTRQALKDRTNTANAKTPLYEDDGDAEGMVKDARPKRGQRRKLALKEDEYVMTKALVQGDSDDTDGTPTTTNEAAKRTAPPPAIAGAATHPTHTARSAVPSSTTNNSRNNAKKPAPRTSRRTTANKKDRDLADDEIVVSSSEAVSARSGSGKKSSHSKTDRSLLSSEAVPTKQRSRQKSPHSSMDRSLLSLSPTSPPAGKLTSAKRSSLAQPGSTLRLQATPLVESSILALKNFKRRQRQPSMLQMVQQRTASARPSAVNTMAVDTTNLGIDDADLEDEDDFAPEAEGTPFLKRNKLQPTNVRQHLHQKKRVPTAQVPPTASPKKRKSDKMETSFSALDALKAKRQKQSMEDDDHELPSSDHTAPVRRSSSTQRRTPQPQLTSDVQVRGSSRPSSTPPTDPLTSEVRYASLEHDAVVPSTEEEQDYIAGVDNQNGAEEEEVPTGTMADPVSSSPIASSPPPPATVQETDIMADPMTQTSPPRPKLRDKSKQKPERKAKPLDTVTLQALLPKRRKPLQPRQKRSEYDIDSDSEGDDDDEPLDTSHLNEDEDELGGRLRRQTKSEATAKSRKANAPKSRQSKAPPRKSAAPAAGKKGKVAKGHSKTYGRGAASDKENEEDFEAAGEDDSVLPETSISMYEATKSTELEALKQKFAELDDWEMEFESVTVEEGRSSSQLWR